MEVSVPCLKCGKKFKAERKSAKFCSAVCRSAYAKQLAKKSGAKVAKELDAIKPTHPKADAYKDELSVHSLTIKPVPSWVVDIEDYCNKAGCTPKDLIDAHKTWNHRMKGYGKIPKGVVTTTDGTPNLTYLEKRLKMKNGEKQS